MEKEQLIALVKKSQSGDAEAIEKLLQYAHTSVSYQCRKMLNNEQDAEDMTQEVLVTIYTKLDTLQEPAAFWKWANQITATRCINALKRTHVEYQFAEDEEGHSILDNLEELDEQAIPDKAIDNAETARMIEEIVTSLPDAQRAATLMFYYNELSVKEIAKTMKVSENTVKSRLNYARKAIKEKVLDYEKQGVKLYGLSPLPFLLYFLRLAAQNSADKDAAGVMVAEVMAAEGTVAGIAGASAAGGGSAAAAAGGSVATATATTTATGIFAGISAKVVAGVLAAVVTIGSIVAVVIPDTQADTTEPTSVSTEVAFATETESLLETEAPTAESTESEITEPVTEVTTAPVETEAANTATESKGTEPTAPLMTESPTIGEHDCAYVVTEHVEATCTTGGWTTATCSVCGDTVTQYKPALWYHVYENGSCVFCGQSESAIKDACDHQYDGGVEYWPAGQMTWEPYILYTCTLCGHTYTELIDYLP